MAALLPNEVNRDFTIYGTTAPSPYCRIAHTVNNTARVATYNAGANPLTGSFISNPDDYGPNWWDGGDFRAPNTAADGFADT